MKLVVNPPAQFFPDDACEGESLQRVVLVATTVHVKPDPSSAVLGQLKAGDMVCEVEVFGPMTRVEVLGGTLRGWVRSVAVATLLIEGLDQLLAGTSTDGELLLRGFLDVPDRTQPSPLPSPTPTPTPATPPSASGVAGVFVRPALRIGTVDIAGAADGLGTVSDDGTKFTAAAETFAGATYAIRLRLRNDSSSSLNGELALTVPEGLRVSVTRSDGVTASARLDAGRWRFVLAGSHNNSVPDLTINVTVDVNPGFSTITGTVRQVAF